MTSPTNRPRCPFYGFHWPEGSSKLIETEHGECALDFDCHEPCGMEKCGQIPNYEECEIPRRLRNFLDAAKGLIVVYPNETSPEGTPFETWRNRIMSGGRP